MKNTFRVHHKGVKSRASSQAQRPRQAKDSVAVLLISNETEQSISPGIDLTSDEFAAIKKDAASRGESLDAWLVRTFNETAALRSLNLPQKGTDCELENAAAANNALLQLLCEHMEFRRQDSGASSFGGGKGSGPLCYGVFQLVESCRNRLTKATGVAS